MLRMGRHDNIYLQRAYDRDGLSAFAFELIEHCPRDRLRVREAEIMAANDAIYNLSHVVMPGSRSANAKLSLDDVMRIRERVTAGEQSVRIAKEYGVCMATIRRLRRGYTYGLPPLPDGRLTTGGGNKLTHDDVREIRRRAANGERAYKIGLDFGINGSMTGRIIRRVSWPRVSETP